MPPGPVNPETHKSEKLKFADEPAPRSASVGTVVVNTVPWRRRKLSTEKAEKLVFDRSATEGGSELILSERWALNPGLIGKKFVRVQNFVAQEFVRGTVPLVGSRFGAEVDDPPGELAPVRPKIVDRKSVV